MRGLRLQPTRRARALRKEATSSEARLWQQLSNRRKLKSFKFCRQFPIGPYFADFACREEFLIIEVDGATHSTEGEIAHDRRRTSFLTEQGYRIVRFTNAEIFENLEGVLETVLAALEKRTHVGGDSPGPSP